MEATLEHSLNCVREWREFYISELPEGLSESEMEGFRGRIGEMFNGAELHVRAIYEIGLVLGQNLSGLIRYSDNEEYRFHLEGLGRHLEDGPEQVKQAQFLVEKTGEDMELREYIAMIAPRTRRTF